MRNFLSILLAAFLAVTSVEAAERALAAPRAAGTIDRGQLEELKAAAAQSGKVSIIVRLNLPFAPEGELSAKEVAAQRAEIATASAELRTRLADTLAGSPRHFLPYRSIPFATLEVNGAELERLAADPGVVSINGNPSMVPRLSDSSRLIRAPEAAAASFTGTGQTVVVIDTGIDKNHRFLAGKVTAEACFLNIARENGFPGECANGQSTAAGSGMPCTGGACNHGTHVAGIIAGRGSSFSGIARDARLISINIYGTGGRGGQSSDLALALDHVMELRRTHTIAAVNVSIGEYFIDVCYPPESEASAVAAAIENLSSVGIATIAPNAGDIVTQTSMFPACIPSAVGVGAVSSSDSAGCLESGKDQIICDSMISEATDLLAPGAPITSSVTGGGFASMGGASMAAAHVAGAWAVLKQRAPAASVADILQVFQDTGKLISDYRDFSGIPATGKRIDVKAALDLIGQTPGVSLNVTGQGQGSVRFIGAQGGDVCSRSCRREFPPGTRVRLEATAAGGSVFTGWSGACGGTGICDVDISTARLVRAVFEQAPEVPFALTLDPVIYGAVHVSYNDGAGLQSFTCSSNCSGFLPRNAEVTFTASPYDFIDFAGWSGACKGKTNTCTLRMSESRILNARFLPVITLSYQASGSGSGTVSFATAGRSVACEEFCEEPFAFGTQVRLTAVPTPGSVFVGWTGACSGRFTGCRVTLQASRSVTAIFNRATAAASPAGR